MMRYTFSEPVEQFPDPMPARVKLRVMRSRTGLGLFALEPIPKGAFIIEYVGEVISTEEGDRRAAKNKYIFAIDETRDIDGSPRWNLARYINHSCRPNADAEEINGRIFITAKRNIMLGEEITYDYGKEYFDDFIRPKGCRCAHCAKNPAQTRVGRMKSDGAQHRVI